MLQRPALANGYGWQRFLHSVNQVMPKRGDTLELPLEFPEPVAGPHKKRRQYSCRCRDLRSATDTVLSLAVMPFNAFVELMAAIIVTFAALVADVFAALGMLTGFMLLMFPALALLVLALALLVFAIAVIPPVVVVDPNNIIRSSCRNRRSFHSGSRPADQTKR